MADEQLDFGDEEYGGGQKIQYQESGAIPALADEEMGEDDEFDDLYNDVNVGENFLQMHRAEVPPQPPSVSNGGFQARNANESRVEAGGTPQGLNLNVPAVSIEGKYPDTAVNFPEQKEAPRGVKVQETGSVGYPDGSSGSQKGGFMDSNHDPQTRIVGIQGSITVNLSDVSRKVSNEPSPIANSSSIPQGIPLMSTNQMSMNMDSNHSTMNENQIRAPIENGATMLFVGELHWWTTDEELENVLSQYGRVKEIKFFDERASGKSKGYCQVEFYDAGAAASCKEGMNGHLFNGRACVVAFASPQTLKQMGASYTSKNQQGQPQTQNQGRRPMNDGVGRGANMNYQGGGDNGRGYARGGWGRGMPGVLNRPQGGGGRVGRGAMGAKNMIGGAGGVGGAPNGGVYAQGLIGPAFGGGMMPPQGMMGTGFDPTYMGRGGGYGGFGGPGFPGMMPSFPGVNAMGLAGVAPHVNPAFFARGMAPNGMGMMGPSGMDGHNGGMWSDTSMGGWGEEPGRRTRESSYGGDDGGSEYGGYGEEKGARSSAPSREKERVPERDWSGNSDRRHRDDRDHDWDRSEREHKEHRYREEKEGYREHRQRERDSGGYDDDWDKGQSSSRSRSRSRVVPEEDYRSRSRDVDYSKKRRLPSE